MSNNQFSSILQLDQKAIRDARPLRAKSIDYAMNLSRGLNNNEMHFHFLWSGMDFSVGVGKPGKEFERAAPNVNDMWPFIFSNGLRDERSASFRDIFYELENVGKSHPKVLELLGCLFIRSAFMLDHEVVDNKVIYVPPALVMDEISKDIKTMFGIPLPVFLQYLEAIALNEDVKYQRRLKGNGKPYPKAAGRQNNLLTCAHLIAVLLGRASIVGFASGFAQLRGVAPIPVKQLPIFFPMLKATEDAS